MTRPLQTPDSVYLPDISEEQIELEHQLFYISEKSYEDLVKGYTEAYHIDEDQFDLALGIKGVDDFYKDYYLTCLLTGAEPLCHNELQVLNRLEQLQQEVLDKMSKLEKVEAMAKSLGLKDRYQDCIDVLETTLHLKLMDALGMDLDS